MSQAIVNAILKWQQTFKHIQGLVYQMLYIYNVEINVAF